MSFGWRRGNYKEVDQPYAGGWKKTSYSEHVPHPVSMDTEGIYTPVIRYSTGQNGERYVVKTERVIRHIAPPPIVTVVTEYRSGINPEEDEVISDYGVEKPYTRVTSAYDPPERVQEFLTRVLDEANRPIKAALPLSSSWHSGPKSPIRTVHAGTNKYGDDQDFKGSDWNKPNRHPTSGKQKEPYVQSYEGTNPMNSDKDVYDRPRVNEGPYVPSRPLSKPTNNIDGAMEYLTEGIKPEHRTKKEEVTYAPSRPLGKPTGNIDSVRGFLTEGIKPEHGTKKEEVTYAPSRPLGRPTGNIDSATGFLTEGIKPDHGTKKEEVTSHVQRDQGGLPPKVVPLSTNWRAGSNLAGKDGKLASNQNDLDKQNPPARRTTPDERVFQNNRGGAKPFDNKDVYEKPNFNDGNSSVWQAKSPSTQKKGINPYPETIDSTEASRRYGKSSSLSSTEEEYEGTINSNEAVKKYNGALVPW